MSFTRTGRTRSGGGSARNNFIVNTNIVPGGIGGAAGRGNNNRNSNDNPTQHQRNDAIRSEVARIALRLKEDHTNPLEEENLARERKKKAKEDAERRERERIEAEKERKAREQAAKLKANMKKKIDREARYAAEANRRSQFMDLANDDEKADLWKKLLGDGGATASRVPNQRITQQSVVSGGQQSMVSGPGGISSILGSRAAQSNATSSSSRSQRSIPEGRSDTNSKEPLDSQATQASRVSGAVGSRNRESGMEDDNEADRPEPAGEESTFLRRSDPSHPSEQRSSGGAGSRPCRVTIRDPDEIQAEPEPLVEPENEIGADHPESGNDQRDMPYEPEPPLSSTPMDSKSKVPFEPEEEEKSGDVAPKLVLSPLEGPSPQGSNSVLPQIGSSGSIPTGSSPLSQSRPLSGSRPISPGSRPSNTLSPTSAGLAGRKRLSAENDNVVQTQSSFGQTPSSGQGIPTRPSDLQNSIESWRRGKKISLIQNTLGASEEARQKSASCAPGLDRLDLSSSSRGHRTINFAGDDDVDVGVGSEATQHNVGPAGSKSTTASVMIPTVSSVLSASRGKDDSGSPNNNSVRSDSPKGSGPPRKTVFDFTGSSPFGMNLGASVGSNIASTVEMKRKMLLRGESGNSLSGAGSASESGGAASVSGAASRQSPFQITKSGLKLRNLHQSERKPFMDEGIDIRRHVYRLLGTREHSYLDAAASKNMAMSVDRFRDGESRRASSHSSHGRSGEKGLLDSSSERSLKLGRSLGNSAEQQNLENSHSTSLHSSTLKKKHPAHAAAMDSVSYAEHLKMDLRQEIISQVEEQEEKRARVMQQARGANKTASTLDLHSQLKHAEEIISPLAVKRLKTLQQQSLDVRKNVDFGDAGISANTPLGTKASILSVPSNTGSEFHEPGIALPTEFPPITAPWADQLMHTHENALEKREAAILQEQTRKINEYLATGGQKALQEKSKIRYPIGTDPPLLSPWQSPAQSPRHSDGWVYSAKIGEDYPLANIQKGVDPLRLVYKPKAPKDPGKTQKHDSLRARKARQANAAYVLGNSMRKTEHDMVSNFPKSKIACLTTPAESVLYDSQGNLHRDGEFTGRMDRHLAPDRLPEQLVREDNRRKARLIIERKKKFWEEEKLKNNERQQLIQKAVNQGYEYDDIEFTLDWKRKDKPKWKLNEETGELDMLDTIIDEDGYVMGHREAWEMGLITDKIEVDDYTGRVVKDDGRSLESFSKIDLTDRSSVTGPRGSQRSRKSQRSSLRPSVKEARGEVEPRNSKGIAEPPLAIMDNHHGYNIESKDHYLTNTSVKEQQQPIFAIEDKISTNTTTSTGTNGTILNSEKPKMDTKSILASLSRAEKMLLMSPRSIDRTMSTIDIEQKHLNPLFDKPPIVAENQIASKQDVKKLDQWLSAAIRHFYSNRTARDRARVADRLSDLMPYLTLSLHQLVQQLKTHCLERGLVLEKIWRTLIQLFDRVVNENQSDLELYNSRNRKMEKELYEITVFVEEQRGKYPDLIVNLKTALETKLISRVRKRHADLVDLREKNEILEIALDELKYELQVLLPNFEKYMEIDLFEDTDITSNRRSSRISGRMSGANSDASPGSASRAGGKQSFTGNKQSFTTSSNNRSVSTAGQKKSMDLQINTNSPGQSPKSNGKTSTINRKDSSSGKASNARLTANSTQEKSTTVVGVSTTGVSTNGVKSQSALAKSISTNNTITTPSGTTIMTTAHSPSTVATLALQPRSPTASLSPSNQFRNSNDPSANPRRGMPVEVSVGRDIQRILTALPEESRATIGFHVTALLNSREDPFEKLKTEEAQQQEEIKKLKEEIYSIKEKLFKKQKAQVQLLNVNLNL